MGPLEQSLVERVRQLGNPSVLVVGDVMLDRYVWGNAERISQEAPVILLRADETEERLGGASSVAMLLRALGARVRLAGVVGNDANGARLRQLLNDQTIDHEGVICDPTRPTTVKERYIGRAQHRHPQQMLRVDYERRASLDEVRDRELQHVCGSLLRDVDILLISDYDKGVCTRGLLATLIASARSLGVRVLVDPMRGRDYRKYHGCSAITPNRLEAGLATGREIENGVAAIEAATHLREALDLEASIITLDREGMALADCAGRRELFSTRPRQVYDITGAGDMVLAVLGLALAGGADYAQAIRLANVAGGLEVEKIGVAPVTREEIIADLQGGFRPGTVPAREKILSRESLTCVLERRRQGRESVAFTNGCFDILHAGHVQYLQEARKQADVLVVGLNSDQSVQALKGPGRPVNSSEKRSVILAALQAVDYVTVFEEATPLELIRLVRPDVLIKGADYRNKEVVGADFVQSYGGRVHLAEFHPGCSTTQVLAKMEAA